MAGPAIGGQGDVWASESSERSLSRGMNPSMWRVQRRRIGWLLMALASILPGLWLVLGGARAFAEDSTSVPSQARAEPLAAAEDEGPRVRVACTPPATEFLGTLGEAFEVMPEALGLDGIEFLNAWGENDRADVVCLFGVDAEAIDGLRSRGYEQVFLGRAIAGWRGCVVVHPDSPLHEIDTDTLAAVVAGEITSWKALGGPDRPLHLVRGGQSFNLYVPLKELLDAAGRRTRPPKMDGFNDSWGAMTAVASDPEAIGFLFPERPVDVLDSGLRILTVRSSQGEERRNPFNDRIWLGVRPGASATARAFAQFVRDRLLVGGRYHLKVFYWCGHIAAKDDAPAEEVVSPAPGAPLPPDNLTAVVALLPTLDLTGFRPLGGDAFLDAWEREILAGIEASRRVTLVDRAELVRVLDEHVTLLLGEAPREPVGAILTAEVLVRPARVTIGHRDYLEVQAVHAATGTLLGRLALPADPVRPTEFEPTLRDRVAAWWPTVLGRLHEARTRLVVTVRGIYPGESDLERAQRVRHRLEGGLADDRGFFLATYEPAEDARIEVLLRLMGLSRTGAARFTPAADYVLEGRLVSPQRLSLHLCRTCDGREMATALVTGPTDDKLASQALAWARTGLRAAAEEPLPPSAGPEWPDEWAAEQYRIEFDKAEALGRQIELLDQRWEQEYLRKSRELMALGIYQHSGFQRPPEDQWQRHRLSQERIRHLERAAQLDPTWEDAAYGAAMAYRINYNDACQAMDDLPAFLRAAERYLNMFQRSNRYIEVLTPYRIALQQIVGERGRSKRAGESAVDTLYYQRLLGALHAYHERFTLNGKEHRDYAYYNFFNHLHILRQYLRYRYGRPDPAVVEPLVQDWSRRYDDHPDKVLHSEFVRLMVDELRSDKAAFLGRLRRLQERWPDPNHPQWQLMFMGLYFQSAVGQLFRVDTKRNSFAQWLRGERGIGDLPWAGYNPELDEQPCTESLGFMTANVPKKVYDAISRTSYEYTQLHPHVSRGFNTFSSVHHALQSGYILVAVGPLPADELPAIKELYSGDVATKELLKFKDLYDGDLPVHRLGLFRDAPDSAPQEILIVAPPGRGTYVVLNDFLRFLHGPQGAEAMAKFGVTVSAGDTATEKPPPNQSNQP